MKEAVKLRRVKWDEVGNERRSPIFAEIVPQAAKIIREVEEQGPVALRKYAERFDRLPEEAALERKPEELEVALKALKAADRELLERIAARIERFAKAQMESASSVDVAVDGGRAGDTLIPARVAGCYAPGGRFPLPSSVLMTAVTARVAGVGEVWLCSPDPSPEVMAAAAIAKVDGLVAVGGAHAIAAMAFGVSPLPCCEVIAGPGNAWVTAAKLMLFGRVGIDLLAGPSELAVLSDEKGDPRVIAADLLAQAEHDVQALPVLVTTSEELVEKVEQELTHQLADLPTAETARVALRGGFAVVAEEKQALRCIQGLAPEHLEVHGSRGKRWSGRLDAFGTIFLGEETAEVFGDYGVGPNHTLPTGGTARYTNGLSVFSFLRRPTWVAMGGDGPGFRQMAKDAAALARMEGLEAHARAAEMRLEKAQPRGQLAT